MTTPPFDSNESSTPPADQPQQGYAGPAIPAPPYVAPEMPDHPPVASVYGAPTQYPTHHPEPSFQSAQPPQGGYQQGYGQAAYPYQEQGYGQQPGYPAYGQPNRSEIGRESASNSLTMGIIAACLAVLVGWIPFFGLVGVAGGIGLGVPAIIQGKRADQNGANGNAGAVLGWVAIAFSALWVFTYVTLLIIGAASNPDYGTSA